MVLVHAVDIFREKAHRPSEWTVEVVTSYSDFMGLAPAWNALVERAGLDHPFLTHEWVTTWWDCFGGDRHLHVVLVKSRDELVGIAPLMRSQGRMYGLPVTQLEFMFNVHTPRMDVIAARSRRDVYRTLWRYLSERHGLWDVMTFHQLPDGSRTLEDLKAAARADGFPMGVWRSDDSPYLELEDTFESYYARVGTKHKSNMRNRQKRLARLGPVTVETIDGGPELDDALQDGFRIEAAAWKGDAHTAIQCNERLTEFYARIAAVAAEKGWLRLHFLKVQDRRIAFGYSLVYGRKFYLLKAGYDPEYSAYSPFNLLCERLLRLSYEERLVEFDFLGKDAEWKMKWTNTSRPHHWLFVFGRHAKPRLIHWAKFRMATALREQPLLRSFLAWVRNRSTGAGEELPTPDAGLAEKQLV